MNAEAWWPPDQVSETPVKARNPQHGASGPFPCHGLFAEPWQFVRQAGVRHDRGEFGRTPMAQNSPKQLLVGRDHHPYAFTVLLAGGGIKGGLTFGRTDDIGYYVTENLVDVRDLQALVFHLLGLDPWKLTYLYQGLRQRLIGVEGKAKIHKPLLA